MWLFAIKWCHLYLFGVLLTINKSRSFIKTVFRWQLLCCCCCYYSLLLHQTFTETCKTFWTGFILLFYLLPYTRLRMFFSVAAHFTFRMHLECGRPCQTGYTMPFSKKPYDLLSYIHSYFVCFPAFFNPRGLQILFCYHAPTDNKNYKYNSANYADCRLDLKI